MPYIGSGRISIASENDAAGIAAGSMLMQCWQNQPLSAEQGRADPDGLCVQLAAGLGFNLFQNNLKLDRRPVGPMGGHRLHHVRHCQHLGFRQNRIPHQAMGIAGTVQPFMMLAHDLGNGPGEGNVFQNGVSGLRVLANQAPFSRSEPGRLGQDLGGN